MDQQLLDMPLNSKLFSFFGGRFREFGFEGSDRLLFHIDEAMSWECVRALNTMNPLILVIDNIARQSDASAEIIELVENVRENYEGALEAIAEGKAF